MSLDFIPLNLYTPLYYHLLLIITLYIFFRLQNEGLKKSNLGTPLLIFTIFFMGFRPVSGVYFGDMETYNRFFEHYHSGGAILVSEDLLFHSFMKICSQVMDNNTFFLICAILYTVPLYVVSKKWFKQYWFYPFLMLLGSFSFWAYGTNGIRNGIASSFFLLAISRENKVFQILIFLLAISFHKTMLLPVLGWVIAWFYNVPKAYFYFWLASIPLSLALPGFWQSLFASMVEDDRSVYFTDNTYAEQFRRTGFRWDFLLYSAMGVYAGWYYIFKKGLNDKTYLQLFNTFLFANAFWILVIRASFSNRFAYLSWFMMALVIIYPWLKYYFEEKQAKKLGVVILSYYVFTYFMNVFVYG